MYTLSPIMCHINIKISEQNQTLVFDIKHDKQRSKLITDKNTEIEKHEQISSYLHSLQRLQPDAKFHITLPTTIDIRHLPLPDNTVSVCYELYTPEDFERFLKIDNHSDIHDFFLTYFLDVHGDVAIDDIKPDELPLSWTIRHPKGDSEHV